MSGIDGLCKHGKIFRNCYTCHIEHNPPKTEVDTLHEMISELKIRVSKLEEYKRLQDDVNKERAHLINYKSYLALADEIKKLDEHRKKQIDENRAVSRHFDRLDEEIKNLDEHLNKIEKKPRISFDPGRWDTTSVRFVSSVHIKTAGTFDEAFKAFMDLKTIKRKNGMRHVLRDQSCITFSPDDILATDWEICG